MHQLLHYLSFFSSTTTDPEKVAEIRKEFCMISNGTLSENIVNVA